MLSLERKNKPHRPARSVAVAVLCWFAIVTLVSGCRHESDNDLNAANLSSPLLVEIDRTNSNSNSDELDSLLQHPTTIALTAPGLRGVARMAVDPTGAIYALDPYSFQVRKFSPTGKYLRDIGKPGRKPGQYIEPLDVTVHGPNVDVIDFSLRRVNDFTLDGSFRSSFIYTPQYFSGTRVLRNPTDNGYILFGDRLNSPEGVTQIHYYDADGNFLSSALAYSNQTRSLNLAGYNAPFTAADTKQLFVIYPTSYTVYKLGGNGAVEPFITAHKDSAWRPPITRLELKPINAPGAYEYLEKWELTWTPICGLAVSNGRLYVEYQSFDKHRYRVDVWDTVTKKHLSQISTNHLLMTSTPSGQLLFLGVETRSNPHPTEVILGQPKS